MLETRRKLLSSVDSIRRIGRVICIRPVYMPLLCGHVMPHVRVDSEYLRLNGRSARCINIGSRRSISLDNHRCPQYALEINFIDEFITCSLHKGSVGETVVRIAQEVQIMRHCNKP